MSEELKAAQARIACLEGEIAKRDARIVELDKKYGWALSELSAIKAQGPVVDEQAAFEDWITRVYPGGDCSSVTEQWLASSDYADLYAAPVSESKAQEPDCDRSACGDFSPGPCDNPDCSARRDRTVVAPAAKAQGVALDGSQLAGLLEQVRLDDDEAKPHGSGATYWNNAVIACQVAIRDALADPVQQVSVPDVSAMARILADRNADACNVNREDNWMIYGQDYIDDVAAMLAAPAAPAADGWISVSERLPGEDDQVLCWCEDETVAWAEVSSHHNSFFTDMTHELLPVTHWMPLPAAPSANSAKGVV